MILCNILVSLSIFGVLSVTSFTDTGSTGGFMKSLVIPAKGALMIALVFCGALLPPSYGFPSPVFGVVPETFTVFSFTLNLPLSFIFPTLLSSSLKSSSSSAGISAPTILWAASRFLIILK